MVTFIISASFMQPGANLFHRTAGFGPRGGRNIDHVGLSARCANSKPMLCAAFLSIVNRHIFGDARLIIRQPALVLIDTAVLILVAGRAMLSVPAIEGRRSV